MLLVAEIILTIFAWKKGWRWWALVPVALALLIGLFMGMGVGASGGDVDSVRGISIVLDVIAVIALIVMVTKGPKTNEVEETKDIENAPRS